MTLKIYISGIVFTTALAFTAFFIIIGFFSPENADLLIMLLLFLSLFIGLMGFFSLSGFFIRKRKTPVYHSFKFLGISFRQGTLFSLLLTGTLFLRAYAGNYWWWGGLVLLLLISGAEMHFLRNQE